MELKWKMTGCDTRERMRLVTWCARLADGTTVWKRQWKAIGAKAHWQGLDEWSAGTPDEVIEESYFLQGNDTAMTWEQLMEVLTKPTNDHEQGKSDRGQ